MSDTEPEALAAALAPQAPPPAPAPPGQILMEEEVYATWAATSLILAVMGTQFSGRSTVKTKTRVTLDLITMSLALLVLLWASLSYFGWIPVPYRSPILVLILLYLIAFFIYVMVLTAGEKL